MAKGVEMKVDLDTPNHSCGSCGEDVKPTIRHPSMCHYCSEAWHGRRRDAEALAFKSGAAVPFAGVVWVVESTNGAGVLYAHSDPVEAALWAQGVDCGTIVYMLPVHGQDGDS